MLLNVCNAVIYRKLILFFFFFFFFGGGGGGGWCDGAMVLGKLPVPGLPTDLDNSRARVDCACNRCLLGCLDNFTLVCHFSLFLTLWETARYRLNYCLKGPLNPKQPTNQLVLCRRHCKA